MEEKITERLSLDEMIDLANRAKRWRSSGCEYFSEIYSGGDELSIFVSVNALLPFLHKVEVSFRGEGKGDDNRQVIGEYFGANRKLRKLYRHIVNKCDYQKQVDANNEVIEGIDCVRGSFKKKR